MRILFISSVFGLPVGGGEVSTELLLHSLNSFGHDTYILTTRKPTFALNDLIKLKYVDNIPTKFIVPGSFVTDHILASFISRKIQDIKPDVINVQDPFIFPAVTIANNRLRLPLIVTCRNNVLDYSIKSKKAYENIVDFWFKIRNRTFLKNLKYVDGIISISKYIKKELIAAGVSVSKIEVIHNIPPKIVNPVSNTACLDIILFAAGRLVVEKGFDVVIKAMSLINKKKSSVKLIIAGAGPEASNLKKMVTIFGLESSVFFTGWISQKKMRELYSISDVILLPSLYPEPFGRGSIEAMSFKKPVVASNIGGIPEAIFDGINGFLVPPGNPIALAEAVLTLIQDYGLREKMGKAGQDILRQEFNPEKILNKTINFYTKILDS